MINLQPKGKVISKLGVQRDLLRVKFSNIDFFVIDVIKVQAIHQYLRRYHYTTKSLQLVLNGFEIYFGCKVLPAREK